MITFKAQYIQPTMIKMKDAENNYCDKKASIVELSTSSDSDFLCINSLNRDWENGKSVLNGLTTIFNHHYYKTRPSFQERFFALTVQEDGFENLNKDMILGVIQTQRTAKGFLDIEHFQVHPDTNYDSPIRNYRDVGNMLLKFIKETFSNEKIITVKSEITSIPFYVKNGFERIGETRDLIFRRF